MLKQNAVAAIVMLQKILFAVALVFSGNFVFADSGRVDWSDWKFDYTTGDTPTGLTLKGVYYRDHQILHKASFPVMRVEYLNDACGPFADILWSGNYVPITQHEDVSVCSGEKLCKRTYEKDGEEFLEMGVNAKLGEYEIYQSYVFSNRGYFDAYVFSRGLQCAEDHTHHAHWRLDFDIDGSGDDQVFKNTGSLQATEFNDTRTASTFWSIQDAETGTRVEIIPGADDGFPDDFARWDVAVRTYKSNESDTWLWGPRGEIGSLFNNNENIDRADTVFWYVTHLEHSAFNGESVWHYSGPRIRVVLPSP